MSSQIASIRETIALEYMAAKWGLEGLRYGTGRHPFISARMERMEEQRQQLNALVGEQEGISLFAETLAHLPEHPTRHHLQDVLRHELGDTEEVAILLDHIEECWETLDILTGRFGRENATKILMIPLDSRDVVHS